MIGTIADRYNFALDKINTLYHKHIVCHKHIIQLKFILCTGVSCVLMCACVVCVCVQWRRKPLGTGGAIQIIRTHLYGENYFSIGQ